MAIINMVGRNLVCHDGGRIELISETSMPLSLSDLDVCVPE